MCHLSWLPFQMHCFHHIKMALSFWGLICPIIIQILFETSWNMPHHHLCLSLFPEHGGRRTTSRPDI
jgi:hypothetical protein